MRIQALGAALSIGVAACGCWHAGGIGGEQDTDGADDTGTDTDTDADTDTDIDADTDTDTDADTGSDTDTEYTIPCGGQPDECVDIGPTMDAQERGCCHGDVLYWCIDCVEDDDSQSGLCIGGQKWLKSFDCQDAGGSCGPEGEEDTHATCKDIGDDTPYSCGAFTKFCEDIGDNLTDQQFGCCLAGFLFDCWQAGYVHFEDCVGTGSMCGYNELAEVIDCIGE